MNSDDAQAMTLVIAALLYLSGPPSKNVNSNLSYSIEFLTWMVFSYCVTYFAAIISKKAEETECCN